MEQIYGEHSPITSVELPIKNKFILDIYVKVSSFNRGFTTSFYLIASVNTCNNRPWDIKQN